MFVDNLFHKNLKQIVFPLFSFKEVGSNFKKKYQVKGKRFASNSCGKDYQQTFRIYLPGGCFGFVSLTDLSRSLAFFTSL
jgi:hypothetical protein